MDYKACKDRAELLNRLNTEENIIYVCCPATIGDCIQFQKQYEQHLADLLAPIDFRKDRNNQYEIYKALKILNTINQFESLRWIGMVR